MGMLQEFEEFAVEGTAVDLFSTIPIKATRCPQCTSEVRAA